jgi:hypothetical protein
VGCHLQQAQPHREHQKGSLAMTLEELLEEFAQNVAAQTDAIFRGDTSTGNGTWALDPA